MGPNSKTALVGTVEGLHGKKINLVATNLIIQDSNNTSTTR